MKAKKEISERQRVQLEKVQAQNRANGNVWINRNGAPNKKEYILEWRQEHPYGTKYRCRHDTKLAPCTIQKWWDECDPHRNSPARQAYSDTPND